MDITQRAMQLMTATGKPALKSSDIRIVERCAEFKDGCYLSNAEWNSSSARYSNPRSFVEHRQYLESIGCLKVVGTRTVKGNPLKVYEVAFPESPVLSFKEFMISRGDTRWIDVKPEREEESTLVSL